MTPKAKKTLLIIGSLMAIGGVVGFILWKRKKKKDAQTNPEQTPTAQDGGATVTVTPSGGGGSGGGGGGSAPSVLTTVEDIKKFQDWLDGKSLKWVGATNSALTNGAFLKKGGGYGNFGNSTAKAWSVYGSDYLKATKPSATTTTPTASGFRKGEMVYAKMDAGVYSKPSTEAKYLKGIARKFDNIGVYGEISQTTPTMSVVKVLKTLKNSKGELVANNWVGYVQTPTLTNIKP